MRWLALVFPQLQLDSVCPVTEQVQNPDATTGAVVVIDGGQQVCQLNAQAMAAGIRPGMKLGTASALNRDVSFVQHDPGFERARALELAEICYQVSANIAFLEPDALIFEVSGMLKLYGCFKHYWRDLQQVLAAQTLHYKAALGHSPLAACVLARAGFCSVPLEQQFAQEGWLMPALDALQVGQLDITPRQQAQLERLGLSRLGHVRSLLQKSKGRKELAQRLGRELLDYLDQVLGHHIRPLDYFRPEDVFRQSILLEHELHTSQSLLFPVKNLLQHMQAYLQRRACRVQHLRLLLSGREGDTQVIALSGAEPERASEVWLSLLQLKLESVQLSAPVTAVRLEALKLLEEHVCTQDIFEPVRASSPSQLLGRLQARLGDEALKCVHLQGDHRPEHAFRYSALPKYGELKEGYADDSHYSKCSLSLRPSLLFEVPVPLSEGIRIVHGPERIQSGWWSDTPVCRDYFVARNTEQQTLWVFRDAQRHWFVHGLFA
ncbi:MAG: hypothetical protein C9356_11380 [Oleiphilus sp.]|nr:MAG: hypothetical protein C9356_11380 [Oleiphilus sp.]